MVVWVLCVWVCECERERMCVSRESVCVLFVCVV